VTVGARGHTDAPVLILKNVDTRGRHFAISAVSPGAARSRRIRPLLWPFPGWNRELPWPGRTN